MSERGKGPPLPRERLVEIVAHQLAPRLGGRVSHAELYDLGVPALVMAKKQWDRRGNFDAFAMQRIRWSILDELRKRRRDVLSMATASVELAAEQHGRTAEELYAGSKVPRRDAEDTIDDIVDGGAANFALDLEGARKVEDDAERIRLRRAIGELPPPQDFVMERYIYFGDTLEEVGRALGMSDVAAGKLHAKAVAALQRRLGDGTWRATSRPTSA